MNKFLILFFISLTSLAQVKGVVKDSVSGKPISFVNIWVENERLGTTSEEDGTFSLNVSKEKNIIFSALGYEKRTVKADKVVSISLAPKVFELNEVVIEKPKATKEVVVGDFSGIDLNAGVSNVGAASDSPVVNVIASVHAPHWLFTIQRTRHEKLVSADKLVTVYITFCGSLLLSRIF